MDDRKDAKRQMYANVCRMYYIEKMSQDEIAQRMHMSRSNISRILSRSVEEGIVHISINDPATRRPDLAHAMKTKFGLQNVIVAPSSTDPMRTARNMGEAAARYLDEKLTDACVLGVTQGPLNYQLARSISRDQVLHVDVVQLLGATTSLLNHRDGQSLVSLYASRFNGSTYLLNAPLMVKNQQVKSLLLSDPSLAETFRIFEKLDVAVLEISSPRVQLGPQLRDPWLSSADSLQLAEVGAIACVCGRYFDNNGMPCNAGINDRIIAIDYETLKKVPANLGLASGIHMAKPTLSILRSGLLHTLIIDEMLACKVATIM